MNAIFLEVNPPDEKGRRLGLGSAAAVPELDSRPTRRFRASTSSSSSAAASAREQALLLQLQEKDEEVKRLVAEQAAQKAKYGTMFAELYAKLGMDPPPSP